MTTPAQKDVLIRGNVTWSSEAKGLHLILSPWMIEAVTLQLLRPITCDTDTVTGQYEVQAYNPQQLCILKLNIEIPK